MHRSKPSIQQTPCVVDRRRAHRSQFVFPATTLIVVHKLASVQISVWPERCYFILRGGGPTSERQSKSLSRRERRDSSHLRQHLASRLQLCPVPLANRLYALLIPLLRLREEDRDADSCNQAANTRSHDGHLQVVTCFSTHSTQASWLRRTVSLSTSRALTRTQGRARLERGVKREAAECEAALCRGRCAGSAARRHDIVCVRYSRVSPPLRFFLLLLRSAARDQWRARRPAAIASRRGNERATAQQACDRER